jgi:hypothetical protein
MDEPFKVCYKGQKHFAPIEIQKVKDNMYIVASSKDQKVKMDKKWKEGDIVYALGARDHKQFAYISKVTPTGKFRLEYLDKKEIVGENEKGKHYIERQVLPANKSGKSILVPSSGFYGKDKLKFKKYNPAVKLTDVVDDISWD